MQARGAVPALLLGAGAAIGLLVASGACGVFHDSGFTSTGGDGGAGGDAASTDDGTVADDARSDDAAPHDALGAYRAAVIADAPVAYFRLDETTGPVVADALGNVPAAAEGALSFAAPGAFGPSSAALDFDGGDVSFGDAFAFGATTAFTVEMWLRVDRLIPSTKQFVMIHGTTNPPGQAGWDIAVTGTGVLSLDRWSASGDGGAAQAVSATTQFGNRIGQFTHVAFTYDGTTQKVYVAGVLAGVQTDTNPLIATTKAAVLGNTVSGGGPLDGAVDEVAVFERALSSEDIARHLAPP